LLAAVASGYFTPASAIWRIGRESVLMLGGGRTLLAQAAHPLVAAGVVQHSRYRDEPWIRLGRTMSAVYTVVFGTREDAQRAARRVRAVHARVSGLLPEDVGPFAAGTPYSARDSGLALWVHASMVENALSMYPRLVGPLAREDEECFWQDMKVVAQLFGLPRRELPSTVGDFWEYWHEMLEGDVLAVGSDARAIAATVLDPPVPLPLRPAALAYRSLTVATLAPELRERYGLPRSHRDRAVLAGTSHALRRALLPVVPARVRLLALERGSEGLPLRVLKTLAA
jgi:uncharacterized protein (DUF2236 family)